MAQERTAGESLAFSFTAAHALGRNDLVGLLGGKAASLVAMTGAGLPVPPGFTFTTAACRRFLADGWSQDFDQAIVEGLAELETGIGKRLGADDEPLLLSVRSGAETSMPGMMDTVLNVGMNDSVERALAALTESPRFAADTHRRALLGFAQIVLAAPTSALEEAAAGADPQEVAARLQAIGFGVPQDPMTQVTLATKAVFESWVGHRAMTYRRVEGIDADLGTAATIQAMVFGNLGEQSGTGVAFSRNPTTGEAGLIGDFMVRAQGEDVVAGTAITEPLIAMADRWPQLYRQLTDVSGTLEQRYRDMVDIEFTVEQEKLWLLQARRGKRSPIAALRIAIDLAEDDGFDIDRAEAAKRCLRYLNDPPMEAADADGDPDATVIASGLGASPGVATGVLCLDPDRAVELQEQGVAVILARQQTSPADVHGMAASLGLFTTLGGQVSHAALVAREWGIPAVVGAAEATIADGALLGPELQVAEGETVTIDGDQGRLLLGTVVLDRAEAEEVAVIRLWAEEAGIPYPERSQSSERVRGESEGRPSTAGAGPAVNTGPVAAAPSDVIYPPLEFRILHALRIKGMATAAAMAAICRTSLDEARAGLDVAVAAGSASFMEPRQMWLITPGGRSAHPEALAQVVADLDLSALPYQRFLALNGDFKRLCTDWQVRDGEPNHHDDAEYDAAITTRLVELDDATQPVIEIIGSITTWMAQYGPRLTEARARFVDGDIKGLTGVMCESYHDVWMELHEDLILTQGIDRAAEGST